MDHEILDLGARTAAELAHFRDLFRGADEFYRYYRAALLNGESDRDQPKPIEWIPISDQ